MRPAVSIVFFTVLSGAGLGLFTLLALAYFFADAGALSPSMLLVGGQLALALVAIGLMSSTFHLANPRNAWRAFAQWRYSWLSREAVLAALFFGAAVSFLSSVHAGGGFAVQAIFGIAGVLLALATLFATGMIYACLRTIPQWHTRLVPLAYLSLGCFSGALIFLALVAAYDRPVQTYLSAVLVLLAIAGIVKAVYYWRFGAAHAGERTLGQAVGATAAQVKLLDVGHANRTFLTDEFVFRLARERSVRLRIAVAVLTFVVPLVALLAGVQAPWPLAAVAVAGIAGLLIERWLFFAEAQHVVRLYHGQARA